MISVVVPIFNEKDVFPQLLDRLQTSSKAWGEAAEFVFIDDGSSDGTANLLLEAAGNHQNVKVVRFSRNFGHQAAISAGIKEAGGDAIVIIDGDLQDPPEVIGEFIAKWREGFDVVYAVRTKRKEGFLKRIAYAGFYRLLAWLSEIPIPLDAGDFCLMDRRVINVINRELPEQIRFLRGLRAFAGFRQTGLVYERGKRAAGTPKYTLMKLLKLSLDGLFGFSLFPLRLASVLGLFIAIPSFLLGMFFLAHRIFNFPVFGRYATETPGLASLAVGLFFLGGVLLIFLGILGEYIGRIYLEVKRRPTYVIESVTGGSRRKIRPTVNDRK